MRSLLLLPLLLSQIALATESLNSEGYVPSPDPEINKLPYCENVNPGKGPGKLALPEVMNPTSYDEAEACPGDCREPHVVFHPEVNGTSRAHLPGGAQGKYHPCVTGQACEICFRDGTECMNIKYAGAGPPYGVFDFPFAFYKKNCDSMALLPTLKKRCEEFNSGAEQYRNRINCIAQPDHVLCRSLILKAKEAWRKDRPAFLECKKMGQDQYNVGKSVDDQRIVRCGYTKLKYVFKSRYNGKSCKRPWHILRPGACREGTFASPSGLDCCSSDPFETGSFGPDCLSFYPDRPVAVAPGEEPAASK